MSETKSISFTVPGQPVPKERPRVVNGHTYTPTRTRTAEQAIRFYAVKAGVSPIEGPVKLVVSFYRKNGTRCDIDNLLKLVSDALNGLAYRDDEQIVWLESAKDVDGDNPRTVITVGAA